MTFGLSTDNYGAGPVLNASGMLHRGCEVSSQSLDMMY